MAAAAKWVLLAYRSAREPSTPWVTVRRKVSRLGAVYEHRRRATRPGREPA